MADLLAEDLPAEEIAAVSTNPEAAGHLVAGVTGHLVAGMTGRLVADVDRVVQNGRYQRLASHAALVAITVITTVCLAVIAASTGLASRSDVGLSELSEPFTVAERAELEMAATRSVLRVHGERCGSHVIGTGFLMDGGVVTNNHLIGGADSALFDDPSGRTSTDILEAPVRSTDQQLDLAGLHATDSVIAAFGLVPVQSAAPLTGERVLLAGYGGGRRLQFLETTIHLVVPGQAYGIDGEVVLNNQTTELGFSGGPVLNRNGEVVAVLKGIDRATELTVAVSASMLAEAAVSIDNSDDLESCKRS